MEVEEEDMVEEVEIVGKFFIWILTFGTNNIIFESEADNLLQIGGYLFFSKKKKKKKKKKRS